MHLRSSTTSPSSSLLSLDCYNMKRTDAIPAAGYDANNNTTRTPTTTSQEYNNNDDPVTTSFSLLHRPSRWSPVSTAILTTITTTATATTPTTTTTTATTSTTNSITSITSAAATTTTTTTTSTTSDDLKRISSTLTSLLSRCICRSSQQYHHQKQQQRHRHHQHHHAHHHHQRHIYLPLLSYFNLRIPLFFLVLVTIQLSSTSTMASPAFSRWRDPCNIQREGDKKVIEKQSKNALHLYGNIVNSSKDLMQSNNQIKDKFTTATFGDPSFMTSFDHISYDWLPRIPSPDEQLKPLTIDDEFIAKMVASSYEYLQTYAVALDLLTVNEMDNGEFYHMFHRIQQQVWAAQCQMQLAVVKLDIETNADMTREVMAAKYDTDENLTLRNVKSYIVLRDLSLTLQYIVNVFEKIKEHVDNKQDR